MLHPHPSTLHRLVREYEELRARHAETGTAEARQRMNDAAYTLCVTTGTRDVDTALMIAERLTGAALPPEEAPAA